jgi:hypothetical protein
MHKVEGVMFLRRRISAGTPEIAPDQGSRCLDQGPM